MALNDISLTSGMRANLLSLQGTVNLLDRTQSRLSSGKKVNTAIDNPVSFFASQALTSRASTIDSLKDAMGQAVQTIQAADKGIKAISAMIEQAKGIAQSALSADANAGVTTVSLSVTGIDATDTIAFGGVTLTATGAGTPGANEFYAGSASAEMDALALAEAINANAGLTMYTATASGSTITISKVAADGTTPAALAAGDITIVGGGATATTIAATTELSDLQDQYNVMRTQISELAEDSGYKGKNLLSATAGLRTLSVQFEGTTLDVVGFDATAAGLGMTAATWTVAGDVTAAINADLELMDAALSDMRQNSSKLAGNLSIITVRQDFSTNMINTLTEGSDKLTLADANEEGANMLMLQTRQTLSTTALSMSAQAAQSVLRLFQ
ncbi:MAG: flagellin N-terminal helical domain-containing protein [Syntrophales bacterium]